MNVRKLQTSANLATAAMRFIAAGAVLWRLYKGRNGRQENHY